LSTTDDGVGKKFSCIPLQDHRINSSDLPEVVAVTSAGSNYFINISIIVLSFTDIYAVGTLIKIFRFADDMV